MRIQHNISALNAHRQLGINNSAVGKNLEKLSSGFRINRAGDDAAGLAISEKMRGQIRGLDMATRNANDGISLIQTAEGALNETHAILQRMRELAVQSSNGTYEQGTNGSDRAQLQKETQALKDEIDRIAKSTHFNNKKLLDGTIGGTAAAGGAIVGGSAAVAGMDGQAPNAAVAQIIELDFSGVATAAASSTVQINGKDVNIGTAAATDNADFMTKLADAYNKSTDTAHNAYTATVSGSTLVLKAKVAGKQAAFNTTVTSGITGASGVAKIAATGIDEGGGSAAVKANYKFKIDLTKLQGGQSIKINGKTISFDASKASGTAAGANAGDVVIGIGDAIGEVISGGVATAANALFASISAEIATIVGNDYDVTATGGNTKTLSFEINAKTAGAAGNLGDFRLSSGTASSAFTGIAITDGADEGAGKPAKFATATFKIDVAKLAVGDILKIGGQQLKIVATGANAKKGEIGLDTFTAKFGEKLEETGFTMGKASVATDGTVTIEAVDSSKTAAQLVNDIGAISVSKAAGAGGPVAFPTQGVTFQIGANGTQDDRVNLIVNAQDTNALGINTVDISTDVGANAAIDAIDAATRNVSSTRADLGALQNRLEHTVANLGVSVENLTAAESRIRDVDMAKEMMEMTKNNILTQAAQAMLAQANTQPQSVLQLLQ